MSSSGKGLAVFGLIIALAGLALGGYSAFAIFTAEEATPHTIDTDTHSIKGTWYATLHNHTHSGAWEHIDNLVVDFTVNPGENIYILYNSYIKVAGFDAWFKIHIDGTEVGYQMRVTSDTPVTVERFSVALQHFIPASLVDSTIGYGAHNVTIYVFSFLNNVIYANSLFVQTFI